MKHLQHGELAVIETIWGHIAGGGANKADQEWMDKRISDFLQGKTVGDTGDILAIDEKTSVLRLA